MAFSLPKGGAFKAPSTSQDYTHNHASQMAHAAHRKLAVAKALSGMKAPPTTPVAPTVVPPGPSAPFKAHVAHAAAHKGVHVTAQHVHNAIDSLTAKGRFTPFQGAHLKKHNAPLTGPAGQSAMNDITNELVTNSQVRR